MRVWFVSTQRAWGGGEVYLANLAEGLRARQWDVRFAMPRSSPLASHVRQAGFECFEFDGRGRHPKTIWRLRQRLRGGPAAIVHCNDSHALTLGGLASLALATTKTIAMRHTMFRIRSAGKYHRLADRTICVSHAVAQQCLTDGLRRDALDVVHVGIAPPRVDAAQVQRLRRSVCPQGQQLVVALGNLLECKGHLDLIPAIDALQSDSRRVVLAIAGEGPERGKLQRSIAAMRHPESVRLVGFQSNPDEWLAAADCVVHPSRQEGLCLTVVAAMMLRRPVVASAVGGLAEVLAARVDNGEPTSALATLCRPADSAHIAAAIGQVLDNRESLGEVLDVAAAHANTSFGVEQMVQRTLDVYRSLQPQAIAAGNATEIPCCATTARKAPNRCS